MHTYLTARFQVSCTASRDSRLCTEPLRHARSVRVLYPHVAQLPSQPIHRRRRNIITLSGFGFFFPPCSSHAIHFAMRDDYSSPRLQLQCNLLLKYRCKRDASVRTRGPSGGSIFTIHHFPLTPSFVPSFRNVNYMCVLQGLVVPSSHVITSQVTIIRPRRLLRLVSRVATPVNRVRPTIRGILGQNW